MLQVSTTKFGFRIRTRQGLVVENLMIHEMYLNCQILAKSVQNANPNAKPAAMSFEEVVTLVTK
ncbi:MAG: hypothetical protein NT115_02070 [Proteobacteria bacterium]|nr:hypothetical protein [Pseudomonadota bacterium]